MFIYKISGLNASSLKLLMLDTFYNKLLLLKNLTTLQKSH